MKPDYEIKNFFTLFLKLCQIMLGGDLAPLGGCFEAGNVVCALGEELR